MTDRPQTTRQEWLEQMAQAAREAWNETSLNHETKRWPIKYAAPWGSLARIGELLQKEPKHV